MFQYISHLMLGALIFTASDNLHAHEPREGVSGVYTLIVGNRVEPPYAGQMNRFDMFVRDLQGDPVEIEQHDLRIKIIHLTKDDIDAQIIAKARLTGAVSLDRDIPGRLNIDYLPAVPGAYGFIIKGSINNIDIGEQFVCGNGTQHLQRRSFSCVQKLQKFPRKRNYRG